VHVPYDPIADDLDTMRGSSCWTVPLLFAEPRCAGFKQAACVSTMCWRVSLRGFTLSCTTYDAGACKQARSEFNSTQASSLASRRCAPDRLRTSSPLLLVSSARACQRVAVLRKIDHRTKGLTAERGAFTGCANSRVDLI
jgi:hypothetical protein